MNPNGRAKTRSLESQMVAIYKLIHKCMVNNETTNVSEACRLIFNSHDLIKFADPSLPDYKKLTDVCKNAENLRKRYYAAIAGAKNPAVNPILSATVEKMQESLASDIERHKQWRETYDRIKAAGHHPAGEY